MFFFSSCFTFKALLNPFKTFYRCICLKWMRLPTCLIRPALEAEEQSIRPALNGQIPKAAPAQQFSFVIIPPRQQAQTKVLFLLFFFSHYERGQPANHSAPMATAKIRPSSFAHSARDDPLKWPALLHIVPSSATLCRDVLAQVRSWANC